MYTILDGDTYEVVQQLPGGPMANQRMPEATAFHQQIAEIAAAETDLSASGGDAVEQHNAAQAHRKYQSSSSLAQRLTSLDGDVLADSDCEANSEEDERNRDGKLNLFFKPNVLQLIFSQTLSTRSRPARLPRLLEALLRTSEHIYIPFEERSGS